MKQATLLLVVASLPLQAIDASKEVPVKITHDKGSFGGQLLISLNGAYNKARAEWNATIGNTSSHKIFRVTFCVRAFDVEGQQIKPGGQDCVLTLWGNNWAPYSLLNFKGKQNIKISEEKKPVAVAKYTIEATEVFDQSPNLRTVDVRCPLVWPSSLRVFADKNFRPTVLDKDSFTATYAYDGGRIDGYDSKQMLKSFTTANTAFLGPIWDSFRIDAASLYLREEKPGTCTAEVKMSFAGFGKPFMGNRYSWYALDSTFGFEKVLLDQIEAQSKQATAADLDKGISQLPTEAPKIIDSVTKSELTITSDPTGAEIEINGEFIGNTPATVTGKEGKVLVKVKKAGFQLWERTLTLGPGDKRTLNAEMVK